MKLPKTRIKVVPGKDYQSTVYKAQVQKSLFGIKYWKTIESTIYADVAKGHIDYYLDKTGNGKDKVRYIEYPEKKEREYTEEACDGPPKKPLPPSSRVVKDEKEREG